MRGIPASPLCLELIDFLACPADQRDYPDSSVSNSAINLFATKILSNTDKAVGAYSDLQLMKHRPRKPTQTQATVSGNRA